MLAKWSVRLIVTVIGSLASFCAPEPELEWLEEDLPLLSPEDRTEAGLQALAAELLELEPKDNAIEKLRELGPAATPVLLELLTDPRVHEIAWADGKLETRSDKFIDDSPLKRICELLDELLPLAAVEPLLPYTEHRLDHFRRESGYLIVRIGSDDSISAVTRLLIDPDSYVRSAVTSGICAGVESGQPTPKFRAEIYSAIVASFKHEHSSMREGGPAARGVSAFPCLRRSADHLLALSRSIYA